MLSVKNKRFSILLTPVIKKSGSKFNVVLVPVPSSTLITWYISAPVIT